ncbi:MAG: cytochrome P450 [Gemmatimonadota bacterium]
MVRFQGSDRSLPAGPSYLVGRDPDCDIVSTDARVSWQHAVLRLAAGRWVLADNGSTNGIYAAGQRVDSIEISGECVVRLGHPVDGPVLHCAIGTTTRTAPAAPAAPAAQTASAQAAPAQAVSATRTGPVTAPAAAGAGRAEPVTRVLARPAGGNGATAPPGRPLPPPAPVLPGPGRSPAPAPGPPTGPPSGPPPGDGIADIPYAIRWLVPNGERFANFGILNDNDTQLDYYRRFGHIYAVGVPTKKWRLVVVSDPDLLDEVAENEEQFGKPVEEINFFAQLSNSRGGGISVIGDGEHYERVRRVMLPWYAPSHQRTQLPRMQEQARRLVAAWAAIPDDQPIDARAWMERYTLEVSGRGACNYDFGLLGGNGDPHPFAAAVPESTKESILRVADPRPDFTLFAGKARRERRRRYRRNNEELFRTAGALVHARQHASPPGQQTDLLSRLVSTPDPETGELLDAGTVRDQVLMHLSNGFNGPSITGAWLAFILATHPDIQEKVIAEIDGVTGGDPGYDLRYEDLLALTYTTQVIKETLRIYPPMPVTIRRSLRDGTLGRYRVRNGDIILVGTLAAQRDPRYWGPDPGRFDPDHFAPDRVAERPRHAFIPFSIGKRQCMAQEVTFMMLRVVLCEICQHYRLRLPPGATVTKNTVVTTKPAAVPIIRVPRQDARRPAPAPAVTQDRPAAPAPAAHWGEPTEIPAASAYRELVIAYGSNFGANKELAERFAERGSFHGYTTSLMTLNELAQAPPRTQPWLLVVMTSTYTSNPPSNATAFKSWLEATEPGTQLWRSCRYLVWGLGNTQWNAFLAFPRYVQQKLAALGATPLADLAHGDVGSPVWERQHADWNARIWPVLLELSGARTTEAAVARVTAEKAATGVLTRSDSTTAMHRSLFGQGSGQRAVLVPEILTNTVGKDTIEARATACRELQAAGSPKRTRHLELSLPPGVSYRAGDHLGVCPKNDPDQVERLARHLGAGLDGVFMVPKAADVRAVPKGVVLQVRNILTSLVDITGRPSVPLVDLLLKKAADPADRAKLAQLRDILETPGGPGSPLRTAADAGGWNVLRLLDDFPSCSLNIFEFLRVAQPLRPRYYSTSSSPRVHGSGVAHVTVGLETAPVPGMPGRDFRGMSSHYLHTLRPGDRVNVFLESADGFHLQDDVAKPMIFVSAGTGFAPMRAFLWERLAMKDAGVALAEAALFTGIRSRDLDFIYRDEIERFAAEGALDHLHVAASRTQPGRREHVQDRLRQEGALAWRLLTAGGYVYVCGSQPMREAVRAALADVAAEHGSLPREQAEAWLQELETTARYRPDLWG